ncbi:VOC family protein [Dyadobacter arcticus]|uniref:3-demethylubiquinone-9 3-methyltransferase (Glyoxalase superfamily) n=1 Tax=Dyadobacter arcticus TaxID=1078754 RepID=A0ABX0UMR0_9BACT|nr:VOC family protein [Dyadobacter arcticus]NIJ54217.1 putative 3-demethylubiquinone-9 3-methyltransferase (glyoxalase superfamily) [Dyadobacter arcticus]
MATKHKLSPNFWFDNQAEEAANFYVSIFKDSKITKTTYYGNVGNDIHGQKAGSVMTVEYEIEGQRFVNLNGGPVFRFNESISFIVDCETQEEIDYYWEKLGDGGDPKAQQCGWLKDKFGVSWQVVPVMLEEMGSNPDDPGYLRAFGAMMQMKKMDIAALEKAYRGE